MSDLLCLFMCELAGVGVCALLNVRAHVLGACLGHVSVTGLKSGSRRVRSSSWGLCVHVCTLWACEVNVRVRVRLTVSAYVRVAMRVCMCACVCVCVCACTWPAGGWVRYWRARDCKLSCVRGLALGPAMLRLKVNNTYSVQHHIDGSRHSVLIGTTPGSIM